MNKFLLVSNLLLLVAVVFLAARYHAARDLYAALAGGKKPPAQAKPVEPDCRYALKAFDFHFKKETDNPNIVMFGNSLIRRGDWPKLLGRGDVINRGIGGDVMRCLAARAVYLMNIKAKAWIIEGGINDLPARKPAEIFDYYKQIVEFARRLGARPILSLVLRVSPKAEHYFPFRRDYVRINKLVDELNAALRRYADEEGVDIIDPNMKLTGTGGLLRDECTTDGVHLTAKGYELWAGQIKAALDSLRI
ncbi:MAG: GDSL-type esterase/lipase family protein [Chloroflexota bacterium]